MTSTRPSVRHYRLTHEPDSGRWQLVLRFGGDGEYQTVARATADEDKDAFESVCRNYVRVHSVSALRNLPRQLTVERTDGSVVETASYDMDSFEQG